MLPKESDPTIIINVLKGTLILLKQMLYIHDNQPFKWKDTSIKYFIKYLSVHGTKTACELLMYSFIFKSFAGDVLFLNLEDH